MLLGIMTRTTALKWLKGVTLVGIYGGLLMPLVFIPIVIFPFVFSKLVFYQFLIGLTFPAYCALAWADPTFRPRKMPLYWAVVAYFVAVGLSVIFGVDPNRAWWGNQERMNGMFTVLHFFLWFTMAVSMLKTWAQWRKLLIYQLILGAFMAIVAILQRPFPNLLRFTAGERVGGLLDNPIYMAAYQIFNLFFIALIWLKGTTRRMKAFLIIFALLDIIAFVLAQSRGALAGLAAGIFVFAITFAIMTANRKTKAAVLGTLAALMVFGGLVLGFRDLPIIRNSPFARFTNLQETSRTRLIAWDIAWHGFLEHPLTGWGFDSFHILFNEKYNPESLRSGYYETWFDRAHNTVMDMLSMTGIFGTIAYFGIFGTLFVTVIRASRKKWIDTPTTALLVALPVAYFIQNLFVFDQPAGFVMSFLLYAMACRAATPGFFGHETTDVDGERSHKPIPWIAYGVLQFAGLLIVWRYSVLPFQASVHTIRSNNYFSAGMLPTALAEAKAAAAIPTPYYDEQTFLQSRNLMTLTDDGRLQKFPDWRQWYDLVKDVSEKHLHDHPRNTHPHFIFGRFLDSFSRLIPENTSLAEQEYLAALKTSPKRQQLLFNLGRFYMERGRVQEGYDMFRRAADADPEVGESRWYVGVTQFYDLNQKEAGAKDIVASLHVKAPFSPRNVRDALTIAQAYAVLKDADGMRALFQTLPTLSGGDATLFLEIARVAEQLGLIAERDVILNALARADASLAPRLAPILVTKTAKTIEESFKMTTGIVPVPVAPAPTTTPTPAASGAGPRK